MIDSKFDSMGDEYNKLIKDFNDGNFESYQKSLETTSEKINQISKDLEKIINDKIKIFQEELIKELDFIIKELKKLYINNQSNLNDKKIFDSANQTEQAVLTLIFAPIFGIGYLGFLAGGAFLAAIPTSLLLVGALVYYSQGLSLSSLISGLGGLYYLFGYNSGSMEFTLESFGWIAVALVIFSVWNTGFAVLGSFVFAALYQLPVRLNVNGSLTYIVSLLPYFFTIIMLISISIFNKKETQPPSALGLTYFREDR